MQPRLGVDIWIWTEKSRSIDGLKARHGRVTIEEPDINAAPLEASDAEHAGLICARDHCRRQPIAGRLPKLSRLRADSSAQTVQL